MNDKIKNLFQEYRTINDLYNNTLISYIENGFELENLTEGIFQIESTLESNELMLRGMLLETDLCKKLELKNINYSFSDLKLFLSEFGLKNDISLITKIIQQYELNMQLQNLEEEYIKEIIFGLKDVINFNIVMTFFFDNNISLRKNNAEEKTLGLLKKEYDLALEKLKELYLNNDKLDESSYKKVINLIDVVYNFFINGSKKIPIEYFREIQSEEN